MPTNEQRRATAKRKLERQLERRAKQARTRRILVIAGGVLAAVAVIAAVVITVINTNNKHKNNTAAPSNATSSTSAASSASPTEPVPPAAPLPPFKSSASVGANCQYQATPQEPRKAKEAGEAAADRQSADRSGHR